MVQLGDGAWRVAWRGVMLGTTLLAACAEGSTIPTSETTDGPAVSPPISFSAGPNSQLQYLEELYTQDNPSWQLDQATLNQIQAAPPDSPDEFSIAICPPYTTRPIQFHFIDPSDPGQGIQAGFDMPAGLPNRGSIGLPLMFRLTGFAAANYEYQETIDRSQNWVLPGPGLFSVACKATVRRVPFIQVTKVTYLGFAVSTNPVWIGLGTPPGQGECGYQIFYDPNDPTCQGTGPGSGSGSGGSEGSGGSNNCSVQWVIIEVNEGQGWYVFWEGYATVCG